MCLSTAYINEKSDDRIAARYVSSIDIDGDKITLTDVLKALDNGILAEMEGEYADDGLGPVINDCFWGKINNELKSYTDSLTLEHFVELCRNRTPESWDMYVI